MSSSNDEDWSDDDDELDEEEAAQCPECGEPIHIITDKCPACGYWLSPDDRHAMWSGMRKPIWLRITTWVILAVSLIPLIALVLTLF